MWLKLFVIICLALIGGCTTTTEQVETVGGGAEEVVKETKAPPEKKPWEWKISKEEEVVAAPEKAPPLETKFPLEWEKVAAAPPAPPAGERIEVSFAFQDASIVEVVKAVLGDVLNLNFTISTKVRGALTFRAKGSFYREELLPIVQAALSINGVALVKENNVYTVLPAAEAAKEAGAVYLGEKIVAEEADIVTQIVPVNFIATQALIPTIKGFQTPAGQVLAPPNTHAVVICDRASNMERLLTIVKAFDVPFFAGRAIKFYDVRNVNVKNIAKDLENLATSLGAPTKGPLMQISFVPVEDASKLLVATASPELIPTIDLWVKNLDTPITGEVLRLYIYKLQHEKAENLAPILQELYSEEAQAISPAPPPPAAAPPAGQQQQQPRPAARPRAAGAGRLRGPMKIIPDPSTNSLLIRARPVDYQDIKRIIEVMDTTPKQVLIEVLIAEVTLTDRLAYGVEYFFRNNDLNAIGISLEPAGVGPFGGFVPKSETDPTPVRRFTRAGVPGGTGIFLLHGDVDAILTLLDQTTNVEVLATPRVMVRHEQKAIIQVGSDEPIATQQVQVPTGAVAGGISTSQSIQYRNIGVILTVTPRIGENNMVTLDIIQEVTSLGPDRTVGGQTFPSFTARKAETSLVVENERTLVIGGIIQRNYRIFVNAVPGLSKIPLLGNLFKSQDKRRDKTELLLVMTPHIVTSPEEATRITEEFEKKLKAIEKMKVREDVVRTY